MSLKKNVFIFRLEEDLVIGLKAASDVTRNSVSAIVRDSINRRLRELRKDFPELNDPAIFLQAKKNKKDKMPLFEGKKAA